MADDSTLRSYRPNDPFRREPAPASERDRSSDPLVELARLIGQSDPFAEIGRSNAREATVRQDSPAPAAVPDWRGSPPPYALMRAKVAPSALPLEPAVAAPVDDYADEQRYAPRYTPEAQYGEAEQVPAHHDDLSYDDTNYAAAAQDGPEHDASYYDDGTAAEQQDEAIYDDPPRTRRRGGMLTALTLIGCAMVGTAGAYGYRTYYVNPGPSSAPVIVADKTPTKVVPASSDSQSSKVIQDRVSDAAPTERVVTREEQPVILKTPTPPAASPVFMAPVAPANTASIADLAAAPPASAAAPPAAAAPTPSGAASSEPKRVRTVTIRADGTDGSARPVTATSSVPRSTAAAAPKAARGAPLQLDPQQTAEPAPTPARPLTPPAPRLASAPATSSSATTGGYVVQVSSQKSETEAQASFRAMQAKYPTAFNGRSPIIRRADLGAKGVFYRALVGPFANAGDAGHFCSSLKAAGGQCIVQKN
jgi:hypothetical protein